MRAPSTTRSPASLNGRGSHRRPLGPATRQPTNALSHDEVERHICVYCRASAANDSLGSASTPQKRTFGSAPNCCRSEPVTIFRKKPSVQIILGRRAARQCQSLKTRLAVLKPLARSVDVMSWSEHHTRGVYVDSRRIRLEIFIRLAPVLRQQAADNDTA